MLITYFVLGLAFAIPELIIVYNCAPLRRFIEANPILELTFSLGLSVVLAKVMGIGFGVTLAVANVMSTIITLAFYNLHIMDHWHATVETWRNTKAQVKTVFAQFSAIIHVLYLLIVGPFIILSKILKGTNAALESTNKVLARAKRAHTKDEVVHML